MADNSHRPIAADRRRFLARTLAGAAALAGTPSLATVARAAEPPVRAGKAPWRLSLAAYSFSRVLPTAWTPEKRASAKMTLEDFIQYCADLGLDGCELTGYYFPKEITTDYLVSLKGLAFRLGLEVSGTAIGNDFCMKEGPEREAQLKLCRDWIDHAAVLGAPVIRIFAGKVPAGDSEGAAIERCVAGIDECLDYAEKKGVALALENHGGITATADQMLRIVKGVRPSPWFGVNFDSGNFRTADPYADLAQIAPWSINAQIKLSMSVGGMHEEADLARVLDILRRANYRGFIVLEYEEKAEPKDEIPKHIARLKELLHAT